MATPKYIVDADNKGQKMQSGVDQAQTKAQHAHQSEETTPGERVPGAQDEPKNPIPVPEGVANES